MNIHSIRVLHHWAFSSSYVNYSCCCFASCQDINQTKKLKPGPIKRLFNFYSLRRSECFIWNNKQRREIDTSWNLTNLEGVFILTSHMSLIILYTYPLYKRTSSLHHHLHILTYIHPLYTNIRIVLNVK